MSATFLDFHSYPCQRMRQRRAVWRGPCPARAVTRERDRCTHWLEPAFVSLSLNLFMSLILVLCLIAKIGRLNPCLRYPKLVQPRSFRFLRISNQNRTIKLGTKKNVMANR